MPALYLSHTFAGGLLEVLTHTSIPRHPPRDHVGSLLEIPDDAGMAVLEPPYPRGWDSLDDFRIARGLAEPWLTAGTDLCLDVPSVPGAPVERNLVVNPRHPRFGEVAVVETIGPIYDSRVWG